MFPKEQYPQVQQPEKDVVYLIDRPGPDKA